jgi:pilus assembly protein CpaE
VIGSKGGVGTTSIAQVLAWNTADVLKQKTMLMDVAGSGGSIGISYGLEPAASMTEVLRLAAGGSDDDLKRVCQMATENLSVLVCGGEPLLMDSPDPDSVEALVNRLMKKYPVVVVDLSRTTSAIQKRILTRAAGTVIVTSPLLSALRNARTLISELKTIKGSDKDISLIVNLKGVATGEEVPEKDMKTALGLEPAVVIAWQPKIFIGGETLGKPVGQSKAADAILAALLPVAAKGAGVEKKGAAGSKEGQRGGLFKKILGKR